MATISRVRQLSVTDFISVAAKLSLSLGGAWTNFKSAAAEVALRISVWRDPLAERAFDEIHTVLKLVERDLATLF